jgi:cytochrome c5
MESKTLTDNPTSDDQVLDLIVLTIGVLVLIAIGLFVIANQVGSEKQDSMNRQDPAYQAAVNERIAPIGRAVVDGEAVSEDTAPPIDAPEEVKVVLTGPQVYNQACTACHSTGAGGAPKVGDAAAWGARVSAGIATLNKHAIEGFQGAAGYMPAKGGFMNLSDEEVVNAVKYMVDESS